MFARIYSRGAEPASAEMPVGLSLVAGLADDGACENPQTACMLQRDTFSAVGEHKIA
jgi:hypothetical protein